MKPVNIIWIFVTMAIILFPVDETNAGSLGSDYRKLVVKRQKLERQRTNYEIKIRKLSSKQRKLNKRLYKCVTKKKDDFWTAKFREAKAGNSILEQERVKLGNIRKDIGEMRVEFETTRVEIERRYKPKTKGSDYETEFRQYMDNLNDQYLNKLETALFSGYKTYLSGIEKHLRFLENSVNQCTGKKVKTK
ncbi:MAG: hypothetical protein GY795_14150 [Desulfobacterales bacterium]|nr:hypothetical protein [Desulfobacterales bacterium]